MAATRKNDSPKKTRRPPATTPDAREKQLTALAYDLAEKQLADGTASAQVINHFLKLGTQREKLERQKLSGENKLLDARVESLASGKRIEELYSEAMKAFKGYAGLTDDEDDYED